MAILSGGGNWITLQKLPVGSVTRGRFQQFEKQVPSSNPAYPPQDILTLEQADGQVRKVGCPTALGRVFDANKVAVGTPLAITYEGKKRGKRGTEFHSFKVETEDADIAFPAVPANEPMQQSAEEIELNKRLEEARARRAA
jgi:hypothetical protein